MENRYDLVYSSDEDDDEDFKFDANLEEFKKKRGPDLLIGGYIMMMIIKSAVRKKGVKKASGVKRARRYCQSCGAYSHVTNDCWNLPSCSQASSLL